MCTGNTYPYWIELAVATAILIGATVVSYGSRDEIRRWKYVMMVFIYGITAVTAGALALGQMQTVRAGDGVCVVWGRWAMFAVTHGAVAALIVLSMSSIVIDSILALFFGTGSALFLVGGALTSVRNGGNAESAAILWTVASGLCVLALFVLLAGVAWGWRRLVLFPAPYKSTDGRANVINRWWYIALVLGTTAVYALYTILYATGPEGWHANNSQFNQTWLTMGLADGLLLLLITPLVFFFINADGSASTATAFEMMAPAETLPTATTNAPINSDGWRL